MVKPLKILFNLSFRLGVLPRDWTSGIICPIYKKNGHPNECSSYRPICLTSVVCKIFEYLIHSQITGYLLSNNLMSKVQHGFLTKRSTTTNLFECINEWTKIVDGKCSVDVMYIDLAKAFDKVSHIKLIFKLKLLGIGGDLLAWIGSFLCNRTQRVRIGSKLSSPCRVTSGIPQGTVLGPLFFILFIDNMSDVVQNANIVLYADDAKLFTKVESVTDCLNMAEDLINIEQWVDEWQMKVNANKSEILPIGHNNIHFPYQINDSVVPTSESCRDLGVYISKNLSFSEHYNVVTRSAHYRRRQMYQSFSCKDVKFQIFLFCTYVRPIVEHNSVIWSPHYICDIDKIESVQRKFTKYLPGMFRLSYPQRLAHLQMESLEVRRWKADLVFLYKIVNQLVDLDFEDIFELAPRQLRGHELRIRVQYSRLNSRKYFFSNRVVPVWNELDNNLVTCGSLGMFKKGLDNNDFSRYCRGCAHTAT